MRASEREKEGEGGRVIAFSHYNTFLIPWLIQNDISHVNNVVDLGFGPINKRQSLQHTRNKRRIS